MYARAIELIRTLGLQPHPEGGHYRETHRSALGAVTSIYFLLVAGTHSRWHRVDGSEEIWNHHEGAAVELFLLPHGGTPRRRVLGPASEGQEPQVVVPAGCWQAARPLGDYALIGCAMAPGFEFRRFVLMADVAEEAALLRGRFPRFADLL